MTPAVSVVIASRNYGQYVAGAIESVLAQTFADWEIIIVDDGSTDDTPVVVKPFLADRRVRYHRTDGLGQSRAKNLGILQARGPLIAFLDGDDEWLPTKLERQLPLFDRPDVGVAYSRRTLMDADGRDLPTPASRFASGKIYDAMLVQNFVCFSSVVVRREVFEAVGMFDPRLQLAIDYDLWLRAAQHCEFDYVDDALVRYRTGHANLSSRVTERIGSILSIMRRSLLRRGHAETANREAQAEAWGSTYRTMAYMLRDRAPFESAVWYATAAKRDGRWRATLRAWLRAATVVLPTAKLFRRSRHQ